MRTILDGAAYERQLIAARTSAALRALRTRGFRPGEVPFGHAADETGRLLPHEGERQTIERVRASRAGGASGRAIVRQLAAEEHQARSGKPLERTQVRRILATSPASARSTPSS